MNMGHTAVAIINLFLLYIQYTYEAQQTMRFHRDDDLKDRLCNVNERVVSNNGSSIIQCASFCVVTQSCASFFHSNSTTECYGCNGTYTVLSKTLTVPGMTHYVLNEFPRPLTCLDHLLNGNINSGVYNVTTPLTKTVLPVYCDMETRGGGWIVWQRRFDGTVDFYRNFSEYENGFGDPSGEYWLGLKYLHEFLSAKYNDVYSEFTDFDDVMVYELHGGMQLDATSAYNLTLETRIAYNDTVFDVKDGFGYNNFCPFSTYDAIDADLHYRYQYDCPSDCQGGWWFKGCTRINPNGLYGAPGIVNERYIYNIDWKDLESLKATKLMIREN